MATREQLMQALKAADAAGETADATKLAQMIQNHDDAANTDLTNPAPPSGGGGLAAQAAGITEQSLAGTNVGLADIVGGPADLAVAGLNKASDLVGGDPEFFPPNVLGSESIKHFLGPEGPMTKHLGIPPMIAAPREGFETSRKVGRLAGQGVGTVATLGTLAPATAIARTALPATRAGRALDVAKRSGEAITTGSRQAMKAPLRTVGAETLASGGMIAGGDVGQELAGDAGRSLGELVGAVTPAGVLAAGRGAVRAATATPQSEAAFDALKASGVTPSPALVGKPSVATVENTVASVPLIGDPIQARQGRQFKQIGEQAVKVAEDIRGAPEVRAAANTDPGLIGERVTDLARAGRDARRAEIDAGEVAIMNEVGPRSPVDVSRTQARIDTLKGETEPVLAGALQREQGNLGKMKDTPIDAAKHPVLVRKNNRAQARLEQSVAQAEKLEAQLRKPNLTGQTKGRVDRQLTGLRQSIVGQKQVADKAAKMVEENLGVPFEQARDFRTQVGSRTEGANLSGGQAKQVYGSLSADFKSLVDKSGQGPAWDRLMDRERTLLGKGLPLSEGGDIPYLHRLSKKQTGAAYNQIVEGGKKNAERWDVIKRNADPQEWANLAGDIFERLGLAKVRAPGLMVMSSARKCS